MSHVVSQLARAAIRLHLPGVPVLFGLLSGSLSGNLNGNMPFWPVVAARVLQGISSVHDARHSRDSGLRLPTERPGEMVGLWALAGGLGSTLAPSLGGWRITELGKRTVFVAALPGLTVSLVGAGWWFIPADPP